MGAFVYINLSTMICCFVFTIFLYFIYFTKNNMDNIENKIYKHLLIWNGLVLIPFLIYQLSILNEASTGVFNIINKVYSGTLATWLIIFTFYIIIVTNEHRKKWYSFFNKKSTFRWFYVFIIIFNIVMNLLPINDMVLENNEFQSVSGPAIVLFYTVIMVSIIVSLVTIIINKKNVVKKKIIPFYCLGPLILIAALVVVVIPQYAVIQLFITLTCYLMYHTIENPDAKLVSELTLAKTQAEKASQAKSDFLSSMSHELRTPLNAIVGLTQMLEMTDDWNEVREDAKDIKKSSTNLLELVDTILSVNSIDNGNVEIKNGNYNPYELFDHIVKVNENRIGNKEIQFKVDISNDLPNTLYGDKDKVKTIIDNLLSNAIKYTDAGYVELVVNCFVVKDKCNLRISVSDTGKGIKDEELEHLFDKFYRSQDNIDSDISGTGLGLSITKSLVDLFEGKINVNSTYGEGTTFFVTFSQGIVNNSVEPAESKNTSITNEVVDNNENNTEIL